MPVGQLAWQGGQELQVFPDGDVAPQNAVRDERDGAAVQIGQIADQPALAEFAVPDEAPEVLHLADGPGALLARLSCREDLPGRAVRRQGLEKLRAMDRLEEILHVRREPVPLFVRDIDELGVLLAVSLVGPAEEDLAAHHAHAGAVAEDVVGVKGLMPAHDGDASRHELGEGIAHAAENPELGGGEAGVVLGHRHAAGADVACHIDLALGHGIAAAVRGMAVHDNVGAGVEPAHIVRGGTHDLDPRVGESHGTHALSGVAGHFHIEGFVPRLPQSAADAVLAEGFHFDDPVPRLDGLLEALLQDPRVEALTLLHPFDDDGGFLVAGLFPGVLRFHRCSLFDYTTY